MVTVSFGAGPIVTGYHLVELPRPVSGWAGTSFLVKEPSGLTGSAHVRIRRSLILEGEVTFASGARSLASTQSEYSQFDRPTRFVADTTFFIDESLSQTSVVGSLLVPVATTVPRVSTFFGGGGGVRATVTHWTLCRVRLDCQPAVTDGLTWRAMNDEPVRRGYRSGVRRAARCCLDPSNRQVRRGNRTAAGI